MRFVFLAIVLGAFATTLQAQTPRPPAASPTTPAPAAALAAHVALVTGRVTVGSEAWTRDLGTGDAVYERQVVTTGPNSYVNLHFVDGGRVLLRPDSQFVIERFSTGTALPSAAPANAPAAATPSAAATTGSGGAAFFRLLRGGFRAISGLIGQTQREDYGVATPVATIGIRGTDYEVQLCAADCPAPAQAATAALQVAATDLRGLQLAQADSVAAGAVVATHKGSIVVTTGAREFRVDAGQVGLARANGEFLLLPAVPDVLLTAPAPDPEQCQ